MIICKNGTVSVAAEDGNFSPSAIAYGFARLAADLTGAGSGGGSRNMAVNGSVTPQAFTFGAPSGEVLRVASLVITVQMTGDPDMSKFGSLSALTNGISIGIADSAGSTVANLYGAYTLKTNADLYRGSYNHGRGGPGQGGGAVDQTVTGVWSFGGPGETLTLDGSSGEKVFATVQDDLSSLPFVSAFVNAWTVD